VVRVLTRLLGRLAKALELRRIAGFPIVRAQRIGACTRYNA
jgi:hypothetical protein